MWDPDVYLAFADHRGRPFYDLVSRIGAKRARRVVDLGCGPGNLTRYLARRWPEAIIEAWDSSPQMVAAARERGIDATTGDLRTWKPKPDTDVVISSAALHRVPEHADLMVQWATELPHGSWIAVQVPGNFETPSHAVVRALARREHYAKLMRDIPFRVGAVVGSPASYAGLLMDAGCKVDAWETTYLHQLTGKNPVLEWITGTALVPVRERLDDVSWEQFRQELIPLLDEAYPPRSDGTTMFPFRRLFIVAEVGGARRSADVS
ncbi:trans-aconitate 2-methyltransferase [Mycobacterium pseudoshottsii]|uniref:trans-aconitate 2-methyltransferase n=1 Tax=Mycobacterium pseudoshottsii TaxID=265949 RepID=UPI00076E961B|nr:trans-aconitate 2-methyltransferase [Mycobacterium pseudoshottsii]MBC9861202.1 Trans-aconitate 2-methyltransferase [Mycobacterium pseudoshottsii]BBA86374.1 putative trans-aconitate 2-methyltransferase [Mycobacterium pseudoshottsii JCM 15466]GAQ32583.1 trans-aconitate 2-methyltransferase [Mycobacterium pseudoshottsii JCM 15466]